MITEADSAIRTFLFKELGEPDGSVIDFSFDLPNRKWSGNNANSDTWVNIYLLELRENLERRRSEWQKEFTQGKVERTKPPFYADLYFLVTVFNKDGDADKEHELLQRCLIGLHNFPDRAAEHIADGELLKSMSLELFPRPYIDDHLGFQLWSAIDQDARPYIPLKVTLPIASAVTRTEGRVLSKALGLTQLGASLTSLEGRVTTASDDAPVEGATVHLIQGGDTIITTVTTDALGIYRFKQVPADATDVEASAEGLQTKRIALQPPSNEDAKRIRLETV